MKKFLLVLTVLLAASPAFAGEKAELIYRKYKDIENCIAVSLSGPLVKMAMGAAAKQLPKGTKISTVYVLGFEKEKFPDTEAYWAKLDRDLCKSMEMVMETEKDGDHVKVFIESQENDITSLSILLLDRNRNTSMVMCTGRIPEEELEKMIEENSKKQ